LKRNKVNEKFTFRIGILEFNLHMHY
jgi:hypothetical protein